LLLRLGCWLLTPVEFAKAFHAGHPTMMTKRELFEEIASRANRLRKQGESEAQAFTRFVTQDSDGIALLSVHKCLGGPDWQPEPRFVAKAAPPSTPSLNTLMAMAAELRKSHPELTETRAADLLLLPFGTSRWLRLNPEAGR
jgi:hypothetical protein